MAEQMADQSMIDKLKANSSLFAQKYNAHLALYPKVKNNPALLAEWQSIKDKADWVAATLKKVNDAINYASNAISSGEDWLVGVYNTAKNYVQQETGLGFVPLIPIAAIAAAAAAVAYGLKLLSDYYTKVNQIEMLKNSGASPAQIQAAINKQIDTTNTSVGGSISSSISTVTKVAVVAGLLYFMIKIFPNKRKGGFK